MPKREFLPKQGVKGMKTGDEIVKRMEELKMLILESDCKIDLERIKKANYERAICYLEEELAERIWDNQIGQA